jgi:cytochrome c-type biogenesis protein CcmH/NrfG
MTRQANQEKMDINFAQAKVPAQESKVKRLGKIGKKINSLPILKYLLYVGIFLIPIWLLPLTADVIELNKFVLISAVAGVGLLLWLISLVSGSSFKTQSKQVAIGVLVFALAIAASTLFGLNKDTGVFGLPGGYSSSLIGIFAAMSLFFLIVGTGVVKKKILRNLIIISTFIALLYGTLQVWGIHLLPLEMSKTNSFNTVGTLNSLVILGAIVFPLLFAAPTSKKMKFVQVGAGVLTLFLAVVVNWWVTWIPLFVGMLGLVGMRIKQNEQWGKLISIPLIIIILGGALVFTGMNPLSGLRSNLPLEVAPSWQASYEMMRDASSGNPTRLAFGYGPESFRYVYDSFRPVRISATLFSDISFVDGTSEFVNTVAHLGAVGVLALLFMLFMVVKMVKKGFRTSKNFVVLPAFGAAVAAFIVYPMNIALYSMFWIFLAMVVITYSKDKLEIDLNKSNLYSAISSAVFTLVLIAVLAGLYFSATTIMADMKFNKALTRTDVVDSVNDMISAVDLNPRNQNYSRALSQILLTAIDQEMKSDKPEEQKNANIQRMMALSVEAAKTATDRDPYNSQNWVNRGYVYENLLGFIDGAEQWAVRSYEEALHRKPSDPFALTRMGRTHLRQANLLGSLLNQVGRDSEQAPQIAEVALNNLNEAEIKFKEALALNQTYGAAIYNLGAVYERMGKLEEATVQLELYRQVRPNDAGLAFELALLHYRLGNKERAFSELQSAVTLFPDYSNARWYLALLHEERGEINMAIAHLERILELNLGNEIVTQKIEQLMVGETTIPPDEITDLEPLDE